MQDTAPRDALLGLHARVEACEPAAWQHPRLIQTYSPRAAVHVLPADEPALRSAWPMRGVRLLVAPDLRLLGQDRTKLFVGPGQNQRSPLQVWFHPHGLVVNGRLAGAWGRQGGKVNNKAAGPLAPSIRAAIHDEAASMPISNKAVTASLTEH